MLAKQPGLSRSQVNIIDNQPLSVFWFNLFLKQNMCLLVS